jgi:hypothetical protein
VDGVMIVRAAVVIGESMVEDVVRERGSISMIGNACFSKIGFIVLFVTLIVGAAMMIRQSFLCIVSYNQPILKFITPSHEL